MPCSRHRFHTQTPTKKSLRRLNAHSVVFKLIDAPSSNVQSCLPSATMPRTAAEHPLYPPAQYPTNCCTTSSSPPTHGAGNGPYLYAGTPKHQRRIKGVSFILSRWRGGGKKIDETQKNQSINQSINQSMGCDDGQRAYFLCSLCDENEFSRFCHRVGLDLVGGSLQKNTLSCLFLDFITAKKRDKK